MSPTDPHVSALRTQALVPMLEAVHSAPVQTDPFPHILIPDFFPNDIYSLLLQKLPSISRYEPFAYETHSNADGESNRKRFRLEREFIETLSAGKRAFWYAIRSALGSVELKQAIFSKLRSGLSYRYGCDPAEAVSLPGFALPELFHETSGYLIKPHPDTRRKVVTMQIALPCDESQKDLGTEFYRRSLRPSAWLREPKGFEVVKTMPFLPNTAYAFVVLNTVRIKSWHGRSTLASSSGVRNSLLNIFYQNAQDANGEIIEENELLLQCAENAAAAA